MPHTKLDHIVYVVPDLDSGIKAFYEKTGVLPQFGGYHKTQGTKNALVHLGGSCYLELISIDEDSDIPAPRWMGVDLVSGSRVSRLALKSEDLVKDSAVLKSYDSRMGSIISGSRDTAQGTRLQWKMTMPLSAPSIEAAPFLLDWSQSAGHPTDLIPTSTASLDSISIGHPDTEKICELYDRLGCPMTIKYAATPIIKMAFKTPKGLISFQ